MSLVPFRRKMRVALDGPDTSLGIDVDPRWRDDLRMLGEQLDFEPQIERARSHILRRDGVDEAYQHSKTRHADARRFQIENCKSQIENRTGVPFFSGMCHLGL